MNQKIITAFLAASLSAFSVPAMAQFGKLGALLGGGSGASVAADPDGFLSSALAAEKLMNNSVTLLSRSLTSKEASAGLAAQRKAANEITDPAEKKAKLTEVQKSELALVNESLSKASIDSEIKKMGDKQRGDLGSAAFNFMLALLQDKALVDQSKGLISSMTTNPAALTKIGNIKDAVSSLSNQLSAASSVAGKMPSIFSAVGVKAPASKDEKPKVVAEVTEE
jgi:hypothetical protein